MKYNLANNEPFEINGDVYVKGIGKYDGTNAGGNNVKTLQEVLDITEITCSDLVNLINNSNLIPGMKYRIIDYNCTTTQTDTRSAGHQFDIIVEALDEKTLSENASAIQHAGDTYFADSNLKSWELKYSFSKNCYVYEGESDTENLWDDRSYNYEYAGNRFDYSSTFVYNGSTYYMWRCSSASQIAVLTEYNNFLDDNLFYYRNYFDKDIMLI